MNSLIETSRRQDIAMLLAAQSHQGTTNMDVGMERYIASRKVDGVYIFDVAKTWEKLFLAARIIAAIENPADVVVMSARPYGQRAVYKFAQYTGCKSLAGRHTPGTFTNYIQKTYEQPRLLIVTDPRTDHQPVAESAYVNIPVVALCDSDSPLYHVDVAIPASNKGKHSIGVLYYLLARMVLQMRGQLSWGVKWEEPVDLFFYKDPEEAEQAEEEELAEPETGYGGEEVEGYYEPDMGEGAMEGAGYLGQADDGWGTAGDFEPAADPSAMGGMQPPMQDDAFGQGYGS
eukprot:TRINITY_DN89889_c0_g1_i3.p1 TRINITY_DN89889_c0_g1~~TRINITY_DN89889_c0_g1_i3.p1  ORF type:complete len:288 (+),score=45.27 TRINITY_DN89889_c0_g1_i3:198-1061(+)